MLHATSTHGQPLHDKQATAPENQIGQASVLSQVLSPSVNQAPWRHHMQPVQSQSALLHQDRGMVACSIPSQLCNEDAALSTAALPSGRPLSQQHLFSHKKSLGLPYSLASYSLASSFSLWWCFYSQGAAPAHAQACNQKKNFKEQ